MTTYTASEVTSGLYLKPRPKQYIVTYFGWSVYMCLLHNNHKNISDKQELITYYAMLTYLKK